MAPFRYFAFLSVLLFFLHASPLSATTVIPVSLSSLTEKADTIVAGIVTDTHAYWEDGRIYTDATVETLEYLKHHATDRPHRLTVKSLGGEVGHTRMEVHGVPRLIPDTEVVLFLMKTQEKYTIYGLHYGLCMVEPDYASSTQRVSGPVFRTRTTRNLSSMASSINPLPEEGERVDLFFQRVRAHVRDQAPSRE